jgi:hypothetical protein
MSHYDRKFELDAAEQKKCNRLIERVLRDGAKTRAEVAEVLRGAKIRLEENRFAHILINAELAALICSGPPKGKQQTHMLLDERVGVVGARDADDALGELTVRYFTSHGPATAKDFRWWSSLTLAQIARGLEIAGSRLRSETIDGVVYWSGVAAPSPVEAGARAAGSSRRRRGVVHLLQAYDEYGVGYSESKHLVDRSGAARAHWVRDRAMFNHLILLDDQIAGCWRRTIKTDVVTIHPRLYVPFDRAATRALQAAADRHAAFLGLRAAVEPVGR